LGRNLIILTGTIENKFLKVEPAIYESLIKLVALSLDEDDLERKNQQILQELIDKTGYQRIHIGRILQSGRSFSLTQRSYPERHGLT
jgi:hypothetical protein